MNRELKLATDSRARKPKPPRLAASSGDESRWQPLDGALFASNWPRVRWRSCGLGHTDSRWECAVACGGSLLDDDRSRCRHVRGDLGVRVTHGMTVPALLSLVMLHRQ